MTDTFVSFGNRHTMGMHESFERVGQQLFGVLFGYCLEFLCFKLNLRKLTVWLNVSLIWLLNGTELALIDRLVGGYSIFRSLRVGFCFCSCFVQKGVSLEILIKKGNMKLTAKNCVLLTKGLSFPNGSNSAKTGFMSFNISFDRFIPKPIVVIGLGGVGAEIEGGGGEEAPEN